MKTHLWCLWSGTKINAKMQISVHNKTLDLSTPQVMGILNVTPDSVYAGSRKQTEQEIAERTNQIILEGGKIIDVGAFSTGPGSADVSEEEELLRMRNGLAIVRRAQPDALVGHHAEKDGESKAISAWKKRQMRVCLFFVFIQPRNLPAFSSTLPYSSDTPDASNASGRAGRTHSGQSGRRGAAPRPYRPASG